MEVDVFKVPHHGSAFFHPEFFAVTGADWAVIPADFDNAQFHHPRGVVVDALLSEGMTIYSTSSAGADNVVLTIFDDGTIEWDTPSSPVFYWREGEGTWEGMLLE